MALTNLPPGYPGPPFVGRHYRRDKVDLCSPLVPATPNEKKRPDEPLQGPEIKRASADLEDGDKLEAGVSTLWHSFYRKMC